MTILFMQKILIKLLIIFEDIESGCGFELDKFLIQQNSDDFTTEVIDTIEQNDFTQFEELVWYARDNNTALLD